MPALWLGFFPFYLEQWMGQFSFLMAVFLWIMTPTDGGGSGGGREEGPIGAAERSWRARAAFWAWAGSVALKSYTVLFAISLLRRRRLRPVLLCAGFVLLACRPVLDRSPGGHPAVPAPEPPPAAAGHPRRDARRVGADPPAGMDAARRDRRTSGSPSAAAMSPGETSRSSLAGSSSSRPPSGSSCGTAGRRRWTFSWGSGSSVSS